MDNVSHLSLVITSGALPLAAFSGMDNAMHAMGAPNLLPREPRQAVKLRHSTRLLDSTDTRREVYECLNVHDSLEKLPCGE